MLVVWCGTMQEITVKAIDAVLVWCCCRVVCGVVDSLCFGFGVVDREKGWKKRENSHAGFTQIKTTHF